MSTVIYPSPIFGPIHSRRLGISLGINLLPADGKVCTFDCIYCECGFNADHKTSSNFPSRGEVAEKLEAKLKEMAESGEHPDVLTFAGNGEPTQSPYFPEVVDDVIRLRDQYCPEAKVSVLSNSTFIHRQKVRDALMKVDNNILKLDTIDDDYIGKVNRPIIPSYRAAKIIESMKSFNGRLVIQTLFMNGTSKEGFDIGNVKEELIEPWLKAVKEIGPREVMIYTIARETPDPNLEKASKEELDAICKRVVAMGIPCSASY